MKTYKLSNNAQDDLQRIWRYGLLHYGEAQADAYFYSLITHFEVITTEPYLYPSVDDIRPGYRKSVCGVDNIYYRIVNDTVEIMAILGRQDSDKWL